MAQRSFGLPVVSVDSAGKTMKARELIRNGSYGPDHLKVLFTAFDQAWDTIAGDVGTNPLAVEAARLKLANIIISLGHEGKDPDWLKNAALQIMRVTMPATDDRGGASA